MPLGADIRNDIRAAKKLRLPWWGVVSWMAFCLPIVWLLDHLGRLDLAGPTLYSIGVLGFVAAMKWKLRGHVWFWSTIAVIVALHVLLILFVPWTAKWVPAIVVLPIAIADFYAMLALISVVGRLMERPKTSER